MAKWISFIYAKTKNLISNVPVRGASLSDHFLKEIITSKIGQSFYYGLFAANLLSNKITMEKCDYIQVDAKSYLNF